MSPGRFEDAVLDPRKLRYFLAIVDCGGFGRAAEQLHVTQSSLSQSIASLERMLGMPLFHRVGRRAVLSETGTALIGPARTILRDIEAAAAVAQAAAGAESGTLDVISMPSPGIEPLTRLVASFALEHPGVRVDIAAAFTPEEVVEALRSGRAEVGVLGAPGWFRSSGLRMIEFESQPLVLVVNPADDRFAGREWLEAADLEGLRLIESQRGSLMRRFVDDAAAAGVRLSVAIEAAHRTSILPLVLAGAGHAVLPSAWQPTARRAGLRVLPFQDAPQLRVSILSRTSGLTPAAAAFLDTAVAAREAERSAES